MTPTNFCQLCKPVVLTLLFLLAANFYNPLLAQTKKTVTNGYGKASYSALQTGKFMKSWLIVGPVSVRADSTDPDNAEQERAFKEDLIAAVNVTNGKPVSPVQVKQKSLQWKMVSSRE